MKTKHKIFLARLAYMTIRPLRAVLGWSDHASVRRGGVNWLLDLKEGIDLAIFLQGRFEPSTAKALRRLVETGDVVLDIGANVGAHTLPLSALVGPNGHVIAFEPTQYAYAKLRANIDANPDLAGRIQAVRVQLTGSDDESPSGSIYSSWPVVGDSTGHPTHAGELKSTAGARAVSLDTFLKEQNIARVDLVKLDVDGYECDVVAGAERTLSKHHPSICFEVAPYVQEERGHSMRELLDVLARHGYEISRESDDKPLPMDEVVLRSIIGDGGSINVIGRAGRRKLAVTV